MSPVGRIRSDRYQKLDIAIDFLAAWTSTGLTLPSNGTAQVRRTALAINQGERKIGK